MARQATIAGERSTAVSPQLFARSLSAPPLVACAVAGPPGAWMRHWRDVEAEIDQPALDHHYLTMHLGGAKRVERRGEARVETVDIDAGALSIVPAGAAFRWSTQGPIEFAHLYLTPGLIDHVALQEFDRDARALRLEEHLGLRDPLLEALFTGLFEDDAEASTRLYRDSLCHALLLRLLRRFASAPAAPLRARHRLAPSRVRRVTAFIEANLATDIALGDLAAVAGSSPFHFARGFADATGSPPYAYLLRRRIEAGRRMLLDSDEPVAAIATRCGFRGATQFSRMFKQLTGKTPGAFRRTN